jgi:sec-independent protein translocase protein TatA
MFGLRMPELLIILAIAVVLFGANKLPQVGAGIGKSIRDLKKALQGLDDEKVEPEKPASSGPGSPKA